VNALPGKEELLAYQRRRRRPAGYVALLGAFVVAGSVILQQVGLDVPGGDSDADQLDFVHAHSGRLTLSAVIQGLGLALFAVPLAFLFRSVRGRTEGVRGAFLPLIVLGPIAFGLGIAISSFGSADAADRFTDREPAVVQQAREDAQSAAAAPSESQSTKGKAEGSTAEASTTTPSTTSTGTTTTATGTMPTAAKPKTPEQAADDAREDLADDVNKDTSLLLVGGLISTIGVLALVFAMVYTNFWCLRTGLWTRFWAFLGIAFGVFLVVPIFPPIPGLVLWFAITGLMLIGRWPRPLPPAWAAGEAIPWPRPGEAMDRPPAEGPPETVEGSGREVSEPPLAENGTTAQPPERPGQRRKKRKRRK